MSEQGVVAVFTRSKGFQWILIAIAVVIMVKYLKREIVDTKCAVKDGAEGLVNKVSNSELTRFSSNVIRTANQVMESTPDRKQLKRKSPFVNDVVELVEYELE